jgi:biopolymer transport protein ExbB
MATATAKPKSQDAGNGSNIFPLIAIPVCFILGWLVYKFVYGSPSNFVDGDPTKEPLGHNFSGMIYKGGIIVPILHGLLFTTIVFVVERFITLGKAGGSGSVDTFVRGIKGMLDRGDINQAIASCDKQRGSVANIVRAGLGKYAEMEKATGLEKDQKIMAIQKEVEEATTLEMPVLEQNLGILATIASIATLFGLLGTVIGMITAFAALSNAGSPDSSALATGISEALINTAFGIGTSAVAIIFYNYFTSRIDSMTYRIDEAGYSLAQTFASRNH